MEPTRLSPAARNCYWQAVEACLVKFHRFSPDDSIVKSTEFRRREEGIQSETFEDLIYHEEPFYVACHIAGMHEVGEQECLLKRSNKIYSSILEKIPW